MLHLLFNGIIIYMDIFIYNDFDDLLRMTIIIKKQESSTCDKGIIQALDDLDDPEIYYPMEAGYLNYRKHGSVFIHAGIMVHGKYRKRGAATKMYKELCKIAKECKIDKVYGQTSNPYALKSRIKIFNKSTFGIGVVPSELRFVDLQGALNHLDNSGSVWIISEVDGCDSNEQ